MVDHMNMTIIVVYVVEKGQSLHFSHIVFDPEAKQQVSLSKYLCTSV